MTNATVLLALCLFFATTAAEAACDPARGSRLFESKCKLCHTNVPGAKSGVGPNLSGVVGRKVAAAPGFRYSQALAKAGGSWTPDRLDQWLTAPAKLYPGTAMAFSGFLNAADRTDVVCYLAADGRPAAAPVGATRSAITDQLGRLERLWSAGDATTMARSLYTEDAIIAGEGQEQAVKGHTAIAVLVATLIRDNTSVAIEIKRLQELGPNAAATWVTWLVTPRATAPAFTMRSLLIWKRIGNDWRIAGDMFSAGDLPSL
jgi:cytochrome c